jgi:DNA-binding transcriptional MocR family regulator
MTGLSYTGEPRPFRMNEPAHSHFPAKEWARVAGRRMRRASSWLQMRDNGRGLHQLCVAIADHLASSRGVIYRPHQIAIVSGVQQALDFSLAVFWNPATQCGWKIPDISEPPLLSAMREPKSSLCRMMATYSSAGGQENVGSRGVLT